MGWMRTWFTRERRYEDLSVSIGEHLAERVDELMAQGMPRAAAEMTARRAFGNVALIAERSREAWQWPAMESVWADVRYALRQLARSPGFTVTALLTLALAIGANTAIFSLMNAVLLRSLPVKDAARLVALKWDDQGSGDLDIWSSGYSDYEFSYPGFERMRSRTDVFKSLFGFASLGFKRGNVALTANGATTPATGTLVTGGFFDGLGVRAALGRLLSQGDEAPGAPRAAVISYDYWQESFGGSREAIGQTIALNGRPYTIVGVAGRGFSGMEPGQPDDVWIPVVDDAALRPWTSNPPPGKGMFTSHAWWWLTPMGRLREGVTPKQAEAALAAEFSAEVHEAASGKVAREPRLEVASGARGMAVPEMDYEKPARVLMGLVLLVLLAACANLATLLLARSGARGREIAVRIALGASRRRVTRQLLTESILLALAGGGLGVLVAMAGTRAFTALIGAGNDPLAIDLRLDGTVLAFTAAASMLTGILFGVAPAVRGTRVDVSTTLKDGAVSAVRQRFVLNKSLVVAQAAISTLLLVGAGLFIHSLQRLRTESMGFRPDHLLVFRLEPLQNGYTAEQLPALYDEVLARVAALPGVKSGTMVGLRLIDGWVNNFAVHVEGYTRPNGKDPNAMENSAGPRFLETTGIPLLAGRDIAGSDTHSSPRVAIVNQAFAKQYFGKRNPIGYHLSYKSMGGGIWYTGHSPSPPAVVSYTIVGVCGDARYESLRRAPQPTWYAAARQYNDLGQLRQMNFELRSDGNAAQLAEEVRGAVHDLDSRLLIDDMKTEEQQVEGTIAGDRMFAQLAAFFGALALLLAAVGLFGTLSYSVTRRTRELGIRMALGAERRVVLGMVMRQGMALVAAGIVLGLIAAALSGRLVASLLYGIRPLDAAAFVSAAAVLGAVAATAAWWPARRAAGIDPMQALRSE